MDTTYMRFIKIIVWLSPWLLLSDRACHQWLLLLTWFSFNPCFLIHVWGVRSCIFNLACNSHHCFTCVSTHWGRVTHKCVGTLTSMGSDNGLSPGRRQTIIWANNGILLIGPLGTSFSEILLEFIHFHSRTCIWKCRLENGGHFVSASMCQPLGSIQVSSLQYDVHVYYMTFYIYVRYEVTHEGRIYVFVQYVSTRWGIILCICAVCIKTLRQDILQLCCM